MQPPYRLLSCAFVLVLACGDNGGATTATPGTDTSTSTTPQVTETTTDAPTTGTTIAPTSTEAMTSGTGTSTTGEPVSGCAQHTNASDCGLGGCEWTQIVGYTHGTQGCQGDIRDFCVPKDTSGGLTSMWNDENGDIEVVQFPFTPDHLPDTWKVCDCDSPLACLCTAAPLDCPDRLEAFCSTITSENSCKNAAAASELTCAWFNVSPEGPLDASCTGDPHGTICLPAAKIGENTCDPISLDYPGWCDTWTQPVFWRDNDGTIEVTTVCGPEPLGWTLCVADDPDQPEECKCRCL